MSLGGSDNDVAGSDAASNGGAKLDSNPALVRVGDTEDRATSGAVWVRISAFLAGKAENSQRTYASAIKEWCSFLGTEAGTEQLSLIHI